MLATEDGTGLQSIIPKDRQTSALANTSIHASSPWHSVHLENAPYWRPEAQPLLLNQLPVRGVVDI